MSVTHSQLQQDVCQFVAKALGLDNPKIVWTIEIKPSWDNKSNTVYLPAIPSNLDSKKIDRYFVMLRGWVDHEAAHSRFSSREIDNGKETGHNPDLFLIANILEDGRVNARISDLFPGSQTNIRDAYELAIENIRNNASKIEKIQDISDPQEAAEKLNKIIKGVLD